MAEEKRADLVSHLGELRSRLLRSIVYATAGMALVWLLFQPIYSFLMRPISSALADVGGQLTVRGLMEGFLVKCQIAMVGGVIVAAPFIFYELWAFVAPGLTRRERSSVRPLVPASGLLFLMGVAAGYLMTGPSVRWLLLYIPPDTRAWLTLNETLLLVLKFYLAFGLAFQLPVVLVLLAKIGIVNSAMLTARWREAVVAVFVIAAVITPTWDPITMTVCAMPMVVLYLATIGIIWLMERRQRKDQAEPPAG